MIIAAVVATGGALVLGGFLIIFALVRTRPSLASALGRLVPASVSGGNGASDPVDLDGLTGSQRMGAWCYQRTPVPLTNRQRARLQLQGTSVPEFYAEKLVMAAVGLFSPGLIALSITVLGGAPVSLPVLVGLIGMVLGFFVPDLLLISSDRTARAGAGEALLTYIDLVTLERLANASASQALHNAAQLSDIGLFLQIRRTLDRAVLEQQSPFEELRGLAVRLDLPELVDITDVMQLEETGASLAGTLRARATELRDAHLARMQTEAGAVSESMTIYMTLPALLFGLFFIVPPVLRILGMA
ncbi:MAG: type II secretion system F family protein [Propionibacteriaceae bacterium]